MKRVIEKGNLAFNHMVNLCDLCKRCRGFQEKNDDYYDCKYNTDGKGLFSGLVRKHMQNFKCKYFKRHQKYSTCKLQSKHYITTRNRIKMDIKFKRGRFKITTV
jgi:hypothetical protein